MTKYTPYWWEEAPRPELAEREISSRCDVAVVGAGYAGLAAALELVRAGRSVQVFDKGLAGGAASSRSGGIASGNLRISFARMISTLGLERAKAYYQEGIDARADLEHFINEDGIDCHWQPVGRLTTANRAEHYQSMVREAELLNQHFDLGVEVVPQASLHTEIGSDAFHGGIVRHDIGGLHPGLLHQGLLDRAIKAGVVVHARTAVSGIRREDDGFEVTTDRGRVGAGDVIVCTNGYTDAAAPWLRRRLVPVPSLILATEPIPPELMDRLCPKRRMLGDTGHIHHYFRPSPDHTRILFGGRTSGRLVVDGPVDHQPLHRKMLRTFPDLAGVGLSHIWWGYVAMNLDHLPQLAIRDGVHYASGFCGSGVVWARWFGRKAALKVLGDAAGASAFEGQRFSAIPFYNGNPWFVPAAVGWYRARDALGL